MPGTQTIDQPPTVKRTMGMDATSKAIRIVRHSLNLFILESYARLKWLLINALAEPVIHLIAFLSFKRRQR